MRFQQIGYALVFVFGAAAVAQSTACGESEEGGGSSGGSGGSGGSSPTSNGGGGSTGNGGNGSTSSTTVGSSGSGGGSSSSSSSSGEPASSSSSSSSSSSGAVSSTSSSSSSSSSGGPPSCGVAPTLSGAACILPESITSNTTLGSACQPWHITSNGTTVADPTDPILTIDPCVTIEVDPGGYLRIGGSNPGGIVAVGTASQHILLTDSAVSPAAGDWGPVVLDSQLDSSSSLGFVDFEYGGQNSSYGYAAPATIEVVNANAVKVSLHDLTLTHNLSNGISMRGQTSPGVGFAASSKNITINDWGAGKSPIVLADADAVATVPAAGLWTGANGTSGQVEITGTTVDASVTWPTLPIPYLLDGYLTVGGTGTTTATLTIAPGNTVEFLAGHGAGVTVGGSGSPGGLVAVGTASQPINFTSSAALNGGSPVPGDWGPLCLYDQLAAGASLGFANFNYGGATGGCGYDSADATIMVYNTATFRVTMHDLTLKNNLNNGISLQGQASPGVGFDSNSGNLTIEDWGAGKSPIVFGDGDAVSTAPVIGLWTGPRTLGGHPTGQIELTGTTIDATGTWPTSPIPYLIDTELTVVGTGNVAPTLTIAPGNTIAFKPQSGARLVVGGSSPGGGIVAVGTASQHIVFTSDAALTGGSPVAGDWGPLGLGDQLVAGSSIGFADFNYGGANYGVDYNGTYATIMAYSATTTNVSLHDLTLTNNLNNGISLYGQTSQGVGFDSTSKNLTINDWGTGLSPIVLGSADAASTVPSSLVTGASGTSGWVEVAGNTVDITETWPAIPIPYLIDNSLSIEGAGSYVATLTIAAPNTLEFKLNGAIEVDPSNAGRGNLIAVGSTNQPITFTSSSATPVAGDWEGIQIEVTAAGAAGTQIENCVISFAGNGLCDCNGVGEPVCITQYGGTTVAGPVFTGNTINHIPTGDYGICVNGAITGTYTGNTATGGQGGLCTVNNGTVCD